MTDSTRHLPPPAAFWERVDVRGPDEHWPWLGTHRPDGYGVTSHPILGTRRAHRIAYMLLVGPIPEGLVIDHLCRDRGCQNPRHMEPVTVGENIKRGEQWMRGRTHCKNGHEFSPANTRISKKGARICRTCEAAADERRRRRDGRQVRGEWTHCRRGHSYAEHPPYVYKGTRICVVCRAATLARWKERQKAV